VICSAGDLPFGGLTIRVIATGWETRFVTFDLDRLEAAVDIELSPQQPPVP
jgi:hypothetical protein